MAFRETKTAKRPANNDVMSGGNRRAVATRRLKIRRRVTPTEALKNATTPDEVMKSLNRKAFEFAEACFLEMGMPASIELTRTVQQALLQDFVEVYNAAVARVVRLPDNAGEIRKLAG
jgi:hypothetical protein